MRGLLSRSSRCVLSYGQLFSRKGARLLQSQVDRNLEAEAAAKVCGSTASIAILHSLDSPSTPFFSAQRIALTVAHVGYAFDIPRILGLNSGKVIHG
jgi:hypothetical protein